MVGWLLLIGYLVFFFITIPSCAITIFELINDEDCLLSETVCLISFIFVIFSIICFVVGYKDTRKEDCLNSGGIYSDIPGERGCVYGGSDKK